jgi:hypothetical protein
VREQLGCCTGSCLGCTLVAGDAIVGFHFGARALRLGRRL